MDNWLTRETLLIQVRNRYDEKSWAEFDEYYRSFIKMIITRMGVTHHDAEDLTQQVLLSAWKALPDFDYDTNKGRFRGWLCQVTGNATKNFFDKRKREVKRHEKATSDRSLDYIKTYNQADIEQIATEEWEVYISNLAWKNIETELADKVREAFLLLTQGKDPADIALELDIERNTIYVYKKRVTKLLYNEINRLDRELG
ncbi:sigma-70 family RNA polymerase sigma factor [Lentisphaera profundi]|uniref:Sigma-70 family RNA polymerase sigma factor n=1 Tax=Lentisphaera profundi TaxID=1658616 RepID=A0ABY7VW60_9BACT|nr:sigma-70 family RNA polymerase sigma factor [Lentisphaera profundi]WDE98463.1 sigma-70 family RNA polymerase sigma factor [Lentisphaera profundi]